LRIQSLNADRLKVRDSEGNDIPLRAAQVDSAAAMCFDVASRHAVYSIEKTP